MTVTGQRLLQEPEAVSDDDDDDDEGNNTILGETRSEESESEESECEESENEESESEEGDESEFEPLAKIIRASNSIFSLPFLSQEKNGCPPPPMLDVIFVGNFPQPPLNHSREKE